MERYEEFRQYDLQCHQDGVLFCKVFFVADRDSIAATLGKRLAQKKMVQDLRVWLDANSVAHDRRDLEEIEAHIDPTDFVAFNKYEENLSRFAEVARNTDYNEAVVWDNDDDNDNNNNNNSVAYKNNWVVVCTSDRQKARLGILKAFRSQLQRFAAEPQGPIDARDKLIDFCKQDDHAADSSQHVPEDIADQLEHGLSLRALLQALLLFLLACEYARETWNFSWDDVV